jgi:hypothetical protein
MWGRCYTEFGSDNDAIQMELNEFQEDFSLTGKFSQLPSKLHPEK